MICFIEKNGVLCPENMKCDYDVFIYNKKIIKSFLQTKKIEGCTEDTLIYYNDILDIFNRNVTKKFDDIDASDIRDFILDYQGEHNIKNQSMDNTRRVLSSFFSFMDNEEYIIRNPMNKVHKIKCEKQIKKPFSDEEIILIQDACKNCRERAIIDFLNYTGVRVSELCKLNIDDIDFIAREGVVKGKGQKERVIYLNAVVKIHLLEYLDFREDDNNALFVSQRSPYKRLTKSGVEYLVSKVGKRAGVKNCHPHRFRRSLATRLIDRGVPIEQVQSILGHNKIDTTLIYAKVNENNVKLSHQKFA